MTSSLRPLPWLLIAALCGCVPYPAYRTARPEVTLVIRDARQRPVEGARVTLVSSEPPFDVVRSRAELWTGADGVVRFAAQRELRVEVLFLYRGPIRFWNWCVEKEGFVTYFSRGPRTRVFEDESVVLLRAGPSQPCPPAFR